MIAFAYSGVHQIFQLALAAHEHGLLNGLFCSLVDGEGRWGRRIGRLGPPGTVRPLGWDGIPGEKIIEYPWPMLVNRLGGKLLPSRRTEHYYSSTWFGKKAARWLETTGARVFVGGETCAREPLEAARKLGMRRVLECAGIPAAFLEMEAALAAQQLGLPHTAGSASSLVMMERKQAELALAEVVLCCSSLQRNKLLEMNPGLVGRSEVLPLWTDVDFWSQAVPGRTKMRRAGPLRVICAGAISLRKGVPFLLEAVEPLAGEVELTLVGRVAPEMHALLAAHRQHRVLDYMPKTKLRELYLEHDLLVSPTLGDSFGFVTIEAMASGMPVITTGNAGAPVPDNAWRVPARSTEALRERILHYLRNMESLAEDGRRAAEFGATFRPQDYRERAGRLFRELSAQD